MGEDSEGEEGGGGREEEMRLHHHSTTTAGPNVTVDPLPPPPRPEICYTRPTICFTRILLGEITPLLAAMKRSSPRWSSHHQGWDRDSLVCGLREVGETVSSLREGDTLHPHTFLHPFLAIIRSEDTTGPVTKTALAAVNRILTYGLVWEGQEGASNAVESIAGAVTHARFVGTDQGADEVVLWEILTVLRTLMLGPAGRLLTNEAVCEILNSAFRICFEPRLSELLRTCTEDALSHMVQLLFARLPTFTDETPGHARKLKMRASGQKRGGNRGAETPTPPPDEFPVPGNPETLSLTSAGHLGSKNSDKTGGHSSENLDPHSIEHSGPGSLEISSPFSSENCNSDSESVKERANTDNTRIIGEPSSQGQEMATNNRGRPMEVDGFNDTMSTGGQDIQNLETREEETVNISSEGVEKTASCTESPVEVSEPRGSGDRVETASVDSGIVEAPLDISHTHLAPETPISSPEGPQERQFDTQLDGTRGSKVSQESGESKKSPEKFDAHGVEFTNAQGVKFRDSEEAGNSGVLLPHGVACVREVLRFLVSLTAPTNDQNTPAMTLTALNLLIAGLEVGAQEVGRRAGLMALVADQLCHHLMGLLWGEGRGEGRVPIFSASARLAVVLVESLRHRLKYQVEAILVRLAQVANGEGPGQREGNKDLALEALSQLWGGPSLAGQLFLNYDCDLYASDLFEDVTRTLANATFPATLEPPGLTALSALLAVVRDIWARHQTNTTSTGTRAITATGITGTGLKSVIESGLDNGTNSIAGPVILTGSSNNTSTSQCPRCPPVPILVARSRVDEGLLTERAEAVARKARKRTLWTGTDLFNTKPDKGVKMLQENNLAGKTAQELAYFFRHNPRVDKNTLGDYLSRKKNTEVLAAFVQTFEFAGQRVDQSLRVFLESFRLPGEAPLISAVIEHFSSHWHDSNGRPLAKDDAAFTLAYAIIMLNVDQHNMNARRQNIPMTLQQFTKNLRGVNGGGDFDPNMLAAIYNAVKKEEIVMPAEHSGRVRDDYQWRMLMRRANSNAAFYLLPRDPDSLDHDVFMACWGPTLAALSCVLDRGGPNETDRALEGFKLCGSVASKLGLSEVLDKLVATLCKFTGLTATDPPDQLAIQWARSQMAQQATAAIVSLGATHGDGLRDAWPNIVHLLLVLFRCRLLPKSLVKARDPLLGHVSLLPRTPDPPRPEASLLSSLYSYISMSDSVASNKEEGPELGKARAVLAEIQPSRLLEESAFLRADSLAELLKAIMGARPSEGSYEGASGADQHDQAFLLELAVRVVEANKDRASEVWTSIRDHIYALMVGAAATKRYFLLDRSVAALVRLAGLLLRRPVMATPVVQALTMLLLLRPTVLSRVALCVLAGLREVVSVNTEHLQDPRDWSVVFTLLECAGAGASPPPILAPDLPHADTLSDTGSVSDSEGGGSGADSGNCTDVPSEQLSAEPSSPVPRPVAQNRSRAASPDALNNTGGWILVGREGEIEAVPGISKGLTINQWDIIHQRSLGPHRPEALTLGVETLTRLVRDRRVTRAGLPSAVLACRTFVEATVHGGKPENRILGKDSSRSEHRRTKEHRKKEDRWTGRKNKAAQDQLNIPEDGNEEELAVLYQQVSEKLLDLMDTLHTSAGEIVGVIEAPTQSDPKPETVSLPNSSTCIGQETIPQESSDLIHSQHTGLVNSQVTGLPNVPRQEAGVDIQGLELQNSPQQGNGLENSPQNNTVNSSSMLLNSPQQFAPPTYLPQPDNSSQLSEKQFPQEPTEVSGQQSTSLRKHRDPESLQGITESYNKQTDTDSESYDKERIAVKVGEPVSSLSLSVEVLNEQVMSTLESPVNPQEQCHQTSIEIEESSGDQLETLTGTRESAIPQHSVTNAEPSTGIPESSTPHNASTKALEEAPSSPFAVVEEGWKRNDVPELCLWADVVCPLLQGMARYCCDSRPMIRHQAMTYLQRALLNHDLQGLSPAQWESCFNKVLFPLLAQLLTPANPSPSLEETRVRAATLVQKVYLRHLTPLLTLPTFTALWLTILDFMDKYLNTHRSDHLSDAIPEILKNMLLVMETTQVFHTADGFTRLLTITWDRIDAFLPHLRLDLFRSHPPSEIHKIEVHPSSEPRSPPPVEVEPTPNTPPTLRQQQAARLSLSQESLPNVLAGGVILQPPLPPISPSPPQVGGVSEEVPVMESGPQDNVPVPLLSVQPPPTLTLLPSPPPPS